MSMSRLEVHKLDGQIVTADVYHFVWMMRLIVLNSVLILAGQGLAYFANQMPARGPEDVYDLMSSHSLVAYAMIAIMMTMWAIRFGVVYLLARFLIELKSDKT